MRTEPLIDPSMWRRTARSPVDEWRDAYRG